MNHITAMKLKNKTVTCANCQKEIPAVEAWLNDNMLDDTIYCFDCATDDCIRLKDLS